MATINAFLRVVIDLLNAPLRGLAPIWGVIIWSIPVGILALIVFGKTSNQERIAAVKAKIHAALFEIRLFNDDLGAILRAQAEVFRHVVVYQRYSLVPMFYILPPLLLLMVHLHSYYGYRGLAAGDTPLLKVTLSEDWKDVIDGSPERPPISLDVPDGLAVDAGPAWFEPLNEVVWRLRAESPGDYELVLHLGEESFTKSVSVTDATVRLSVERPGPSFMAQLEWPSEPPLPGSGPISSVVLTYPVATMSLLWLEMEWEFAWMVVFFVITIVVALAVRKPLGVEF